MTIREDFKTGMIGTMPWDRRFITGSALTWILPFAVIAAMVVADPSKHTVTPVYHRAVEAWWAGKSLYLHDSYFYFPHFAVLFTPFHLLPVWLGDTLWRFISIALTAWGTWRLFRCFKWPEPEKAFLFCSIFTLLPSLGALHNGQANLIFAAVLVHAIVFLAGERWTAASICFTVLLILKPIALVPMLLAPVVYRQMIKPLIVLLFAFIVLLFFFGDTDYVFTQYRQLLDRLFAFSVTQNHIFADINGLFRTIGVFLPGTASQILRMVAGLAVLGLWIFGANKSREPRRALTLLALSTTYLMLFNPMTEVNSYAIVAPALAVHAVYYYQVERREALAWWLVFANLSIAFFPEIFRRLDRNFGLWWDPLLMLILGGMLVAGILGNKLFMEEDRSAEQPTA